MGHSDLFGPKAKPVKATVDSPTHRVIALYCHIFGERFKGEQPVITAGDGKAVKTLIAQFGEPKILERLPLFMALDDAFLQREGYPLRLLPGAWNKLAAMAVTTAPSTAEVTRSTDAYLDRMKGAQ